MVKNNSVHACGTIKKKNRNLFNIIINPLVLPSSMFLKFLWAPFHATGNLLN